MVIAIIVAFVVVIHVQCLVSVYLSLVKIKYSVCVWKKKKNSLEGINNRITEAEEQINDLEDRKVEITTAEQTKEKRMKRIEDSLRDLWGQH